MKTVVIFLLLSTLSLASQNIYNAKHVTQVNNTLYDKRTKEPIDGVIEAYFLSGKLQETIPCKKGVPNGVAVEYYESGEIKAKIHYKNGVEVLNE